MVDRRPGLGLEPIGEPIQALLRLRDSGPARQVVAERLLRPCVGLLRQVADREVGRHAAHGARVGVLETGQDAEQRRLAGAVRADEPDAAPRRHDQGDVASARAALHGAS